MDRRSIQKLAGKTAFSALKIKERCRNLCLNEWKKGSGGIKMGYIKCPRCELNYMPDTERYCSVCKARDARRG